MGNLQVNTPTNDYAYNPLDTYNRIIEIFEKNGKSTSQTAIGDYFGFGQGTISNWKNNFPGMDTLIKICCDFHVSLDWLVFGKEPINNKPVATQKEPDPGEPAQTKKDIEDYTVADVCKAIIALSMNFKMKISRSFSVNYNISRYPIPTYIIKLDTLLIDVNALNSNKEILDNFSECECCFTEFSWNKADIAIIQFLEDFKNYLSTNLNAKQEPLKMLYSQNNALCKLSERHPITYIEPSEKTNQRGWLDDTNQKVLDFYDVLHNTL